MKPHFHKVPISLQHTFSIRKDVHPYFPKLWHYHPELEIHLTLRGEGVKLVGDNISNFAAGEIVFLGENLPHCWRSGKEYYQKKPDLSAEAIIIQFHQDCFGREFFNLPEAHAIKKLFERAKKGLLIKGHTKAQLTQLIMEASTAEGMHRFILLLKILNTISETEEYDTIASAHAFCKSNEAESLRLSKIYDYALSNYSKDISIQDIASVANLSETSFCRYFKTITKKTFYNFLLEVRLSHVCRYLLEDRDSTEVICFKCGFRNLSNFYRQFRKVTGNTPLEYKRQYMQ